MMRELEKVCSRKTGVKIFFSFHWILNKNIISIEITWKKKKKKTVTAAKKQTHKKISEKMAAIIFFQGYFFFFFCQPGK